MSLAGALGWAIQFVDDPDSQVQLRSTKRQRRGNFARDRISKVAVHNARPLVLAAAARHADLARWAGKTPEQRQAHISGLNALRAVSRLARKTKAA